MTKYFIKKKKVERILKKCQNILTSKRVSRYYSNISAFLERYEYKPVKVNDEISMYMISLRNDYLKIPVPVFVLSNGKWKINLLLELEIDGSLIVKTCSCVYSFNNILTGNALVDNALPEDLPYSLLRKIYDFIIENKKMIINEYEKMTEDYLNSFKEKMLQDLKIEK